MTGMAGFAGLMGWRWLFLPDRPAAARFLSDDEKRAIAADLAAEAGARGASGDFAAALRDRRTYILALVYFAFYSTQSVLLLWVPTLLRNAGAHDLQEIGWRGATVFVAGAVGMAAIGWSSDRLQERRWHLVGSGLVAGAALAALPLAAHSPSATTLLLAVAAVGIFAYLALFWTVPTVVFGAGARAGGIALVSAIGASGSALSPTFIGWTQTLTGSLFGSIAALAAAFVLSLALLAVYAPTPRRAASENLRSC